MLIIFICCITKNWTVGDCWEKTGLHGQVMFSECCLHYQSNFEWIFVREYSALYLKYNT